MAHADHDEMREQLALEAAGALTPEEAARLEAHLESCAACRAERAAWRDTTTRLAGSVVPVRPSAELRSAVLARAATLAPPVSRTTTEKRRASWPRAAAAAAAAVALVALGAFLGATRERSRLDVTEDELAAVSRQLASAEARLAGAQAELAASRSELAVVPAVLDALAAAGPEDQVLLAGQGIAADGRGRVVAPPGGRRAVFFAADLPPLPGDRTYQLWTIAAGQPRSAGTFDVDERGLGLLVVETDAIERGAGAVDTWAVTVEPAGGVPQPTGDIILVS